MLAAVAAATAAGELSLGEAQLPTPETQALDELMADIAEDVLAEAAVAAAFAEDAPAPPTEPGAVGAGTAAAPAAAPAVADAALAAAVALGQQQATASQEEALEAAAEGLLREAAAASGFVRAEAPPAPGPGQAGDSVGTMKVDVLRGNLVAGFTVTKARRARMLGPGWVLCVVARRHGCYVTISSCSA